jgi:hypothetical protein
MDGTVLIIAGDNGGAKNNAAAVPFRLQNHRLVCQDRLGTLQNHPLVCQDRIGTLQNHPLVCQDRLGTSRRNMWF